MRTPLTARNRAPAHSDRAESRERTSRKFCTRPRKPLTTKHGREMGSPWQSACKTRMTLSGPERHRPQEVRAFILGIELRETILASLSKGVSK